MRIRTALPALGFAVAILVAACGDDSGGSPFGADSGEADEVLEGLDIDDLDLEALAEGDFDELDLEGLIEGADGILDGIGGTGSGVVEIAGGSIEFEAEVCFVIDDQSANAVGPGTSDDGTAVFVSLDYSVQSREELLEFMDESTVELLYGDADPIVNASLEVDFGRDGMFSQRSDESLPLYEADPSSRDATSIDVEIDESTVEASGDAVDATATDTGSFPFTVRVSCG